MRTENPGLPEARHALTELFGYSHFKAAQEEVIGAALAGDDVLAVLQTGYGKSVCFQIPAMLVPGCAIVVSPLIALMKDQVDNANQRGISASFVNSHLDPSETNERLAAFVSGEFKLFYVAPERLASRAFREALQKATVNFIVVDEAHCASVWGHDFRPAFARIHEISSMLWRDGTRPTIIAVTATATAEIEDDIAAAVGMDSEYVRIVGDPIRPNLSYEVLHPWRSEWGTFLTLANRFREPGKHLAYAVTRGAAEKLSQYMNERFGQDFSVAYHGGMDREERTRVQDNFVSGKTRVVCATNAFGMGIDVPDIRTVVHFGFPGSIEAYVQETGRAGRDGKESSVILIPTDYSVDMQTRFIDANNPPIQLYKKFWSWLVEAAEGGVTLKQSAETLAYEASQKTAVQMAGAQVATILNVLEAHGLVRREYYTGGHPIRFNLPELAAASFEKPAHAMVAERLIQQANQQFTSGAQREITLDKAEAAADVGMSLRAFDKALSALKLEGLVQLGRLFTGKTTSVLRPDAVLDDVLPIEHLQSKRKRDRERFVAMNNYADLKGNDERKQFIRDYFLSDTGTSRREVS